MKHRLYGLLNSKMNYSHLLFNVHVVVTSTMLLTSCVNHIDENDCLQDFPVRIIPLWDGEPPVDNLHFYFFLNDDTHPNIAVTPPTGYNGWLLHGLYNVLAVNEGLAAIDIRYDDNQKYQTMRAVSRTENAQGDLQPLNKAEYSLNVERMDVTSKGIYAEVDPKRLTEHVRIEMNSDVELQAMQIRLRGLVTAHQIKDGKAADDKKGETQLSFRPKEPVKFIAIETFVLDIWNPTDADSPYTNKLGLALTLANGMKHTEEVDITRQLGALVRDSRAQISNDILIKLEYKDSSIIATVSAEQWTPGGEIEIPVE